MKNNNEIELKLSQLRDEYKNKLPEKVSEINGIWNKLQSQTDTETLNNFHRMIHSLHGSAATFGYAEIAQVANNFENLAKSFIDSKDLIQTSATQVEEFIKQLTALISANESDTTLNNKFKKSDTQNMLIYLLDNDKSWQTSLVLQMKSFGYEVICFDKANSFIEKLNQQIPAILIININTINDELQNLLLEKVKEPETLIPIIFISTNGEFSLRLKSVRLGGKGFFIKPFLIDDLIERMDKLLKSDAELYRILIIDDEIDVANYNAAILEQANMKTCVITKAIEIDKALHEFNPDLILIDLVMPECNGVELAAIIRQQNLFQSTPIIYLSAESDPLKQLNAMKLGADDFITKSTESIYLIMKIRNRIERYKKLSSMMDRDNLTGLYNHSFLLKQLEIELKESMLLHNPLSIVILDLDNIKSINTTYGHQAGDHVLKSLGLMIRKRLNQNEIVGRYGGEKFMIILPNTPAETAKSTIDELRRHFLTINYSWNEQIFNSSFSAGIASFPEFPKSAALITAADEALENSTKTGRNKVSIAP